MTSIRSPERVEVFLFGVEMALRKRTTPSGVTGLVDPSGRPVSAAELAAADRKARGIVALADVVGERPPDEVATTAHFRVRAFYRRLIKGGQREDSLLTEIAHSDDRGWLENLLAGLDAGSPGPSKRTRRRWRAAAEFRLSQLPVEREPLAEREGVRLQPVPAGFDSPEALQPAIEAPL